MSDIEHCRLFYCKTCDSDPFTKLDRCFNFDSTLEQFHLDQGHEVIPYQEKPISITDLFTQKMNEMVKSSTCVMKSIILRLKRCETTKFIAVTEFYNINFTVVFIIFFDLVSNQQKASTS